MIDRELLGKIKDKTDKNDDSFTDVPPGWLEVEQEGQRKKGKGCLTVFAIGVFLLIVLAALVPDEGVKKSAPPRTVAQGPSAAALESEYAVYFEKPCLQSARYDNSNGNVRAEWKDGIKEGIINQARKYDHLSYRKRLYAAKVANCEKIIKSAQNVKGRESPEYIPDYEVEIEKYVVDRCYRKLVRKVRPDLPAPNFTQIEKIKSVMRADVERTIRQIYWEVRGKPYKERMKVYESAMHRCRLPY